MNENPTIQHETSQSYDPMIQSPQRHTPNRNQRSSKREMLSTIGVFVMALAVAFLLITFVFQSYQVDGPSMQNTLQNNDRLIVWKLPRTWARITGHNYIPGRGDIIVFTESASGLQACGQFESKQIIKRVIGLPGDRVVVNNGTYTVYNHQYPKGFNPDKTLPYHQQITEPTTGNIDLTLNKDQIFVSGDNRTDSCDSRNFGPINANQINGHLVLRLLPINKIERF